MKRAKRFLKASAAMVLLMAAIMLLMMAAEGATAVDIVALFLVSLGLFGCCYLVRGWFPDMHDDSDTMD